MVLSIIMFIIAYFVVGLTVLSISAIATNGAVKEGGAYCILYQPLKLKICGIFGFCGFQGSHVP